jgi:hypothetical protein
MKVFSTGSGVTRFLVIGPPGTGADTAEYAASSPAVWTVAKALTVQTARLIRAPGHRVFYK